MPRVSTPPAAAIVSGWRIGERQALDAATIATRTADGAAILHRDGSTETRCEVAAIGGAVRLSVRCTVSGPGAPRVTVPDAAVVRVNRFLSSVTAGGPAPVLYRDWHTRTHGVRFGPGSVAWLADDVALVAECTGGVWRVTSAPVATPSKARPAPTMGAPVAPTVTPSMPVDAHGSPEPVPDEPAPDAVSAPDPSDAFDRTTPAAYRGKVILSPAARKQWAAVRVSARRGKPKVVCMVGPSGAGKTHAVHDLAASEGLPVVKFDASGVVEPGDWFGTVTLDREGTRFVESDLLRAITVPGKRVLLIDEANRAALRATNALLPVLDGSGSVTIPQTGRRVRVNPDVQVVFTCNIGAAFLGTEPLDEAIRTRIGSWILMPHLSEDDERGLLRTREPELSEPAAAALARIGRLVREASEQSNAHAPVSTRALLNAADLIAAGLDPDAAVETAILNGYSDEGGSKSERAKVKVHTTGVSWTSVAQPAVEAWTAVGNASCRNCSTWGPVNARTTVRGGVVRGTVCAACYGQGVR